MRHLLQSLRNSLRPSGHQRAAETRILLRTNIFVCLIITLGFIITCIISYRSNMGIFEKDAENVTNLASEGIYYQINSLFIKPVNISLTMANDSLLMEFLSTEEKRLEDKNFIRSMQEYLQTYQKKYGYDSVFLVSTKTNRYYHFHGLDRHLLPGDPENEWYYDFLNQNEEYSLNIDNDEASADEITLFINCKIKGPGGKIMGVVGVGFRVKDLQSLLKKYEQQFDVQTYLVDSGGMVEIATDRTGYEKTNLFDIRRYSPLKDKILSHKTEKQEFWYTSAAGKYYVVSCYIKNLNWFLIIEKDTAALQSKLRIQLMKSAGIILVIIALVLWTITRVILNYNKKVVALTVSQQNQYYEIYQENVKQLYENVYELDITHNCPVGENTERYFESLGVPPHTPFDLGLKIIAEKQIKEEFRQGYIDTFSPQNVLAAYHRGVKSLKYDFMITTDGITYYWMRITACIYYWSGDHSVRMTTYRQNIDEEKNRENALLAQMQSDPLTGLYNKAATEACITQALATASRYTHYALFILDIDDFKNVNDTLGHAAGDCVIASFGHLLKGQFRMTDIIGRIGGDEFMVFLRIPHTGWLDKKAASLVGALNTTIMTDAGACTISSSIGIAVYPQGGPDFKTLYRNADEALYRTKLAGKNGYTIYEEPF